MTQSAIQFNSAEDKFSVTRILADDHSRIRFTGSVCVTSVQLIVDAVEEAFDYYHYSRAVLEINSPGGDAHALTYLLEHCRKWRNDGRIIATRGILNCASAGALMLAFGDIGTRQVSTSTTLLFHYCRTTMNQTSITAHAAKQLAVHLNGQDRRMVSTLVDHVMPSGENAPFDGHARMQARYVWLDTRVNNITTTSVSSSRLVKKELTRLRKLFTGSTGSMRDRVIDHLNGRFNEDLPMSLLEAYVLNLVDDINDITPTTEPPLASIPVQINKHLSRSAGPSQRERSKCPAAL